MSRSKHSFVSTCTRYCWKASQHCPRGRQVWRERAVHVFVRLGGRVIPMYCSLQIVGGGERWVGLEAGTKRRELRQVLQRLLTHAMRRITRATGDTHSTACSSTASNGSLLLCYSGAISRVPFHEDPWHASKCDSYTECGSSRRHNIRPCCFFGGAIFRDESHTTHSCCFLLSNEVSA